MRTLMSLGAAGLGVALALVSGPREHPTAVDAQGQAPPAAHAVIVLFPNVGGPENRPCRAAVWPDSFRRPRGQRVEWEIDNRCANNASAEVRFKKDDPAPGNKRSAPMGQSTKARVGQPIPNSAKPGGYPYAVWLAIGSNPSYEDVDPELIVD